MAAHFTASTARALSSCGWTVWTSSATRVEGVVRLRVTLAGEWFARIKGDLVASGRCAEPSCAAMDANEFAWAYRGQHKDL